MARARNIKPGFFTNDALAECQPLARLLFAGLWTLADREGRLEDRPKKIKAEILPYDNCNIDELLNELAAIKEDDGQPAFIVRYEYNCKKYVQIMHFVTHQNPHQKEAASTIPAPDLSDTSTVLAPDLNQTSIGQEQCETDASTGQAPDLGGCKKQGNGENPDETRVLGEHQTSTGLAPDLHSVSTGLASEKHRTSPADSPIPITDSLNLKPSTEPSNAREEVRPVDNFPAPDGSTDGEICMNKTVGDEADDGEDQGTDFMAFWNAYPRRSGMSKAMEAWKGLVGKSIPPADLVRAAQKYRVSVAGTAEKFIKMPHTFLVDGLFREYAPKIDPECPLCKGQGYIENEQRAMVECRCRHRLDIA